MISTPLAGTRGPSHQGLYILEASRHGDQLRIGGGLSGLDHDALRPYRTQPIRDETLRGLENEIVQALDRANRASAPREDLLESLRRTGLALFDEIMPHAIKEDLARAEADQLELRITDDLVRLPWELLYDGKEFLCRRFAMGRVVAIRQTVAGVMRREIGQPARMLVIADPTGDLPGAYREALEIRDSLADGPLLVDMATTDVDLTFVREQLRDYDLLHYAGHSDDEGKGWGWRLQDGHLRADEVRRMAGSSPLPALIVANACSSARAARPEDKGMAVFGLANAFLIAGARHYVGTIWDVPDRPGATFATALYGRLAAGGTVGEAVLSGRQAVASQFGDMALAWASYVLYGSPDKRIIPCCEPSTLDTPVQSRQACTPTLPLEESKIMGGRFQILERLGTGGMGEVYKARDLEIDEVVAIKFMHQGLETPEIQERFRREAKLARRVTHRNVSRIYDLSDMDGRRYITMEYVEGESLEEILRRQGKLPIERGINICRQACAGLGAVHDGGVIHRDIKPANIMIEASGRVVILDIGIARLKDTKGPTQTGSVMGTPAYMSPEQIMGKEVDGRSDIYSLGVTLFELFVGTLPFSGSNPMEVAYKQINDPPPSPRALNPHIPAWLNEVILQCLEKDPDRRIQSMRKLDRALQTRLERRGGGVAPPSDDQDEPQAPLAPLGEGEEVFEEDISTDVYRALAEAKPHPSRRWILILGMGALAMLVGFAVLIDLQMSKAGPLSSLPPLTDPPLGASQGEVIITTVPEGALVALDEHFLGTAPLRRKVIVGEHTLRAEAPGYKTKTISLSVGERLEPLKMELEPEAANSQSGMLLVEGPQGLTVKVDGVEIGVTPLREIPLAPGFHDIDVSSGDQAVQRGRVEIQVGARVSFVASPEPVQGLLTLEVEPAGAEVRVDGARVGQTPLRSYALAAGTREIEVLAQGHAPWTRSVLIQGGEEATVKDALQPLQGRLTVTTTPPGARLHLDGQDLGQAPLQDRPCLAKTSTLKVQLQGHGTHEQPISIPANDSVAVHVRLKPSAGRLTVLTMLNGKPTWAKVWVDGQEKGFTPLTISPIPAGQHSVRVSRDEIVTQTKNVTVRPDAHARVRFDIKGKQP